MKKVFLMVMVPLLAMGQGQVSRQEVVVRNMNVRGNVTKVLNSAYTSATIDTSMWYTLSGYNSVYVAVQSKDSASCLIRYQTSASVIGDEGEVYRDVQPYVASAAKTLQLNKQSDSLSFDGWYALIRGIPYLLSGTDYTSEDAIAYNFVEVTTDKAVTVVVGEGFRLYKNYYPHPSIIATKDSLVASTSGATGDLKVVDLSAQLKGAKSFRLIFAFNSGGKNGTGGNTYTAILTRKEF
jgi:hypothetical protein